jgi:hypothetical protein
VANSNAVAKLVDTQQRAVIKMTGIFDGTGQETGVIKVDASSLAFAMNANNMIMSSNTHPRSIYRLAIKKIVYNIGSASGHVKLFYDNSAGLDGTIIAVRGSGVVDEEGIVITNPNDSPNSNGDIVLTTLGFAANDSYTILLDIKKDPQSYSRGGEIDSTLRGIS